MRLQLSLAHSPKVQFKPPIVRPVSTPCVTPSSGAKQPVQDQFDSDSLLRGAREVLIRHGGEVYRLRHTRNDKLILTK